MQQESEVNDTRNLICSVNTASQSSSITTFTGSDNQTANDSISPLQEEQEDLTKQLQEDKYQEDEQETRCGFRECHPDWLQKFASKKCYVLVYGLTGMVDLITTTYFNSTISTIEKRFKIQSKMSGFLSSTFDIGVLSAVLFLAYLGSSGNKSRWLASGFVVIGLACFMRLVPHVVYGPGEDALELTEEYIGTYGQAHNNSSVLEEGSRAPLCMADCKKNEVCSSDSSSNVTIFILLASMFIMGAASSMYNTLGISYMDDNAKKNKTPGLLAIWQCIRMLGPTLGYMSGSYALSLYVDTSLQPVITNKDPRWIGAWWLGWAPLGFINIFLAILLALFPKNLPRAAERMRARGVTLKKPKKSLADFKRMLQRLIKNRILIFNTMSTVFFLFGLTGFWVFLPKYIENQFKQTASLSSFVTGIIGLICSTLGVMASGFVITKFKPRARYLAAWNVFTEALEALGNFSFIFITCSVDNLQGSLTTDHSWNMTADCNFNCGCGQNIPYSPICSSDGKKLFYSPCHAGCQGMNLINGKKTYDNCSCIDPDGWGVDGPCPVDCSTPFIMFIVIQFIIKFFSASGRAGNTIIQFRCVAQEDKSVSIAFTEVLLCALAFIPGPILFGMLIDSSCIVWGLKCDKPGNCWLYDVKKMGFLVNLTASGFLLGGTLLDIGVWYYAKDLDIYDKSEGS